jgi:predicted nucleotidyltransferase
MMSSSQTNFEAIRKQYESVFVALERVMTLHNMDFYLIGAQSRDVWTNHLSVAKRTTYDIDFAVYVPDQSAWEGISRQLVENENFRRDPIQPYRFYHDGMMLDLVPFGGLEKDGEVILENPHMELSVYGCTEVTAGARTLSEKYKVITLPGLCVMKLIAYNEKPDRRQKDWDDFLLVLSNYGDIAGEELFAGQYDDLMNSEFEFPIASARMLGRHIQAIVNKNADLKGRIIKILLGKHQGFTSEEIDQMYQQNKSDRQVIQFRLIDELTKGVVDQLK